MNDFTNMLELPDVSNTFDQDYRVDNHLDLYKDVQGNTFSSAPDYSHDIFHYADPLKFCHKFHFKPLIMNVDNTHFVKPHHVDGYFRKDGTYVAPYYRDGDGDTTINRIAEQGGGYLRSNPDGNPFNNLK
ncbi:hypothetical protein EJF36_18900 [Bacillus sp. HMF5848]|uniref:hypothetical protein n=1 Tax=Bacillus sp. HMF5848 TaxID=2495421 RepID=UPI000F79EF44|nr:hypothetical protein [Bacillus sp. HMF5848]RSK28776.1 hypothetical protein EJF36_18900 [Bacillus sp. HMF5848]